MIFRCVTLFVVCLGLFGGRSVAADLRIYTRVYDRSKATPEPVSRSLTIFHKGKVYDYIDSLDEVIVYEPKAERFTVLNTRNRTRVVIATAKIERLMKAARNVVGEQIAELRKRRDVTSIATADMLAFQLDPKFKTSFDAKTKSLSLQNRHLRYDATFAIESQATAEAYRRYADWVVRLNYVLYPRVVMPSARRILNAKLAAKQGIPITVELTVNTRPGVSVRAAHRISRSLDQKDRALLSRWNAMLTSKTVKSLSLRDYQSNLGIRKK